MKKLHLAQFSCDIAYREFGDGPVTIVYLAGLNMPVLKSLSPTATHAKMAGSRSILVDYLGAGNSDHPADFSHSTQDHAKPVASVLDHQGIKDCITVGHSMGGTVAIYLAL